MRPLIAANWKMHGDMSWTDKPAALNAHLPMGERDDIDILICPPFPFLAETVRYAQTRSIYVGAQNCHAEPQGAYTGEVSADMLKSIGVDYVIVGHSERRAMGESDADVKAKARAAQQAGLIPIICVGETWAQRERGTAKSVIQAMLLGSLPGRKQADKDGLAESYIIAYEPVWAIGTGQTASLEDITDMHKHIRKAVGRDIRLLYGGSVKPDNAEAILAVKNVNGALIGGASLDMESLSIIARAAS